MPRTRSTGGQGTVAEDARYLPVCDRSRQEICDLLQLDFSACCCGSKTLHRLRLHQYHKESFLSAQVVGNLAAESIHRFKTADLA